MPPGGLVVLVGCFAGCAEIAEFVARAYVACTVVAVIQLPGVARLDEFAATRTLDGPCFDVRGECLRVQDEDGEHPEKA